MDECCRKGFRWNGVPTGKEAELGKHKAYVTGDSTQRAVLVVHDGFGWDWNNTRLLADHYAQEIGATAYIPDFFDGFRPTEKDISITRRDDGTVEFKQNPDFDWKGWLEVNGSAARLPDVIECGRLLRKQYSKVAAVGYCWGGAVGFMLASKELEGLFDCISIAHPATPTKEQVQSISVPFQILAPEHDPTFTPEWQDICNTEIPKLGVQYHYQYFPGMLHGFCTKCNEQDEREKQALEIAKNAVVYWFKNHL